MKVVEKDRIVSGMLRDEYQRCQEMVSELEHSASALPKGSLQQRQKYHKENEYSYYFLKYREGSQSLSKHVAEKDVEAVKEAQELSEYAFCGLRNGIENVAAFLLNLEGDAEFVHNRSAYELSVLLACWTR